jgi:hypothetical protein
VRTALHSIRTAEFIWHRNDLRSRERDLGLIAPVRRVTGRGLDKPLPKPPA